MLKKVLVGLAIVVVCVIGWELYIRNSTKDGLDSGTVTQAETSTSTDLDGRPLGTVGPTPSRSDAPGTVNGEPVAVTTTAQGPSQSRVPVITPTASPAGPSALPVSDTVAPNPPNGLAFGGTGKFQWYRQGDLTWRVNTESGAACIAFATMEQWQKPIVYTHGCGNS